MVDKYQQDIENNKLKHIGPNNSKRISCFEKCVMQLVG
jgi:hypothetical protein